MDEKILENFIYMLIDKFNIKRKLAFRAEILKAYNRHKDNNNEFLASVIIIANYFKEEKEENK